MKRADGSESIHAHGGGWRGSSCGRVGYWRAVALAFAALFLIFAKIGVVKAQIGSARYSSIVIDAATGQVLSAANPDAPRYPASLTKMMTLYMVFEALRDHRLSANSLLPVSWAAASVEPSKLGLRPGMRITVQEAILALVTKSANDAAVVLAESLGGSEARFAQMMTLRAHALGMEHTTFRNASGLPDPLQVTTARDMATLARRLINDFPNQYGYFSVPGFRFRGRLIPNHDNLLKSYPGADGIKTGYTEAAGHNLVTSAVRNNVRLIGVVMGAASNPERDAHMEALLDAGFERMNVPVEPREPRTMLARMPSLVPSAHAAVLHTHAKRFARNGREPHHLARPHGPVHVANASFAKSRKQNAATHVALRLPEPPRAHESTGRQSASSNARHHGVRRLQLAQAEQGTIVRRCGAGCARDGASPAATR